MRLRVLFFVLALVATSASSVVAAEEHDGGRKSRVGSDGWATSDPASSPGDYEGAGRRFSRANPSPSEGDDGDESRVEPGAEAMDIERADPVSLVFTGIEATGVDHDLARAVSEYVQSRLSELGAYDVIGPAQIETLLGLEAQRQLMGCESDAACLVDIAGSLAAERVMSGRMSRIGKTNILTIFLVDASGVRTLGNADRTVRDDEGIDGLLDLVPGLVRQVVSRDPLVVLPPEPAAEPTSQHVETGTPESRPTERPSEIVDDSLDADAPGHARLDPRSGLLIGLRTEARRMGPGGEEAFGPVYSVNVHGQGGPIGMGLGVVRLSGAEPYKGFGARGELRVMPYSFRNVSPYLGLGGLVVHLPGVEIPIFECADPGVDECEEDEKILAAETKSAVRAAPSLIAGTQVVWSHFAVGLDLSWAFADMMLVDEEPRYSDDLPQGPQREVGRVLGGLSFGLSLSLRL